jgi:hypothetical protein
MAFYRYNALIYIVLGNVAHVLQEETELRKMDGIRHKCKIFLGERKLLMATLPRACVTTVQFT